MKKTLRIFPVLMLLAAASCEIPFALDNVSEPAFYVQYLPGAGMSNDMMVAYAEPAFEKPGKVQHPFRISDVKVLVNGVPASLAEVPDTAVWNRHRLTVSAGSEIKPGDRIEVSVSGGGAPEASSSTVIPKMPGMPSLSITPVTRDSSDAWQISMKMASPVADGDYFGLKAKRRRTYYTAVVPNIKIPDFPFDPSNPVTPFAELDVPDVPGTVIDTTVSVSYFTPGQIASTADINSLDLDGYTSVGFQDGFINTGFFSGEPLMLLTVRQFAGGDTYTFYANTFDSFDFGAIDFGGIDFGEPAAEDDPSADDPGDMPKEPEEPEDPEFIRIPLGYDEEYALELYRLSDEFYNYAKAQYLVSFNMLSNFGVTPPNFTYTNVSGGLGVVAGLSAVVTPWLKVPQREADK